MRHHSTLFFHQFSPKTPKEYWISHEFTLFFKTVPAKKTQAAQNSRRNRSDPVQ
ncbi:uncharacterized protein METZ01_LOCUS479183, partial [marine metagenome]